FDQTGFNALLADMLADDAARRQWGASGLAWAERADIYSLPERAADIILKP
ncbi:MAG: glycosyltransferase family 1 protein, partial [Microbacteriaceae bacterium]|nr:glycosyltransferase family 1 protein [Microbacteriaceae bacterium]